MDSFADIPGFIGGGDDDYDEVLAAPQASTNKDIDQKHVNELVAIVRRKSREGFRDYLHSIPKPDLHLDAAVCDADQNTVMHLVVQSCDEDIIRTAVEAGGAVNLYENCDGETPLTLAVQLCPNMFGLMLRESKKPKAKRINSRGQSLLHAVVTAKATGRPWPDRALIVRELLEAHNLSIKQTDNSGCTPCEWARQHFLGLGSDGEMIVEMLSKSQTKRLNASKAEFVTFFKAPVTRLMCVAILIVLHSLQYACETHDRPPVVASNYTQWYEAWPNGTKVPIGTSGRFGGETFNESSFEPRDQGFGLSVLASENATLVALQWPHPAGQFPFVFSVFNMVGSTWYAPTRIIAAHIGCLGIGMLVGAIFAMLVLRELIGRTLLSLRIFGADADRSGGGAEALGSENASVAASLFALDGTSPAAAHGSSYTIFIGIFSGIFCGALMLNMFLERNFKDDGGAGFVIADSIGSVTGVQLLRAAWVVSLMIDWLVLVLVLDVMMQQLSANIMIPDPAYHGFGLFVYPSIQTWRMIWFWGGVPLGWLAIFLGFGLHSKNTGNHVFETPLIANNASPAVPLALVSLSMCFTCLIIAQDWTLPYRRCTPELLVPGLREARSNLMWLLWFLLSITMAMDCRLFVGQVTVFVDSQNLSDHLKRFELAMAILPAFLGSALFLITLARTSSRLSGRRSAYGDDETKSQSVVGGPNGNGAQRSFNRKAAPPGSAARSGGGGLQSLNASAVRPAASTLAGSGIGAGVGQGPSAVGMQRVKQSAPQPFDANQPTRPPSSAHGRKSTVNDIWTAAAADDVVKLCTMLEKDSLLVNAKGGPGIECDAVSRTVTILPPAARAGPEYAAAPIHYAVAAGARATLTALLSRGANPRLRTVHGMFSCRELVEIINNPEIHDVLFPPSVPPGSGAAVVPGHPPAIGGAGAVPSSSSSSSPIKHQVAAHDPFGRAHTNARPHGPGEAQHPLMSPQLRQHNDDNRYVHSQQQLPPHHQATTFYEQPQQPPQITHVRQQHNQQQEQQYRQQQQQQYGRSVDPHAFQQQQQPPQRYDDSQWQHQPQRGYEQQPQPYYDHYAHPQQDRYHGDGDGYYHQPSHGDGGGGYYPSPQQPHQRAQMDFSSPEKPAADPARSWTPLQQQQPQSYALDGSFRAFAGEDERAAPAAVTHYRGIDGGDDRYRR